MYLLDFKQAEFFSFERPLRSFLLTSYKTLTEDMALDIVYLDKLRQQSISALEPAAHAIEQIARYQ